MALSTKLEHLVRPVVESHSAFLIDIKVGNDHRVRVVEIFIETETGVNSELCAVISREVAPILDESGDFNGPYNIVVSSPGLDRPLSLPVQYRRNTGRNLAVTVKAEGGPKKLTGQLVEVRENAICLKPDGTSGAPEDLVTIPFDAICEAVVVPRW